MQVHTLEKNFNRQALYDYVLDLVDGVKHEYIKDMMINKEEREIKLAEIRQRNEDLENKVKTMELRSKEDGEAITLANVKAAMNEEKLRKIRLKTKALKTQLNDTHVKIEGQFGLD